MAKQGRPASRYGRGKIIWLTGEVYSLLKAKHPEHEINKQANSIIKQALSQHL